MSAVVTLETARHKREYGSVDTLQSVTVVTSPTLSQRTRKDRAPSRFEAIREDGPPAFSPNLNPTNFAAEFKAYHVQFDVGNALLNMKAGPGGNYTGYFNVPPNGQVNWKKGDTFKVITPDLQQRIKENYQNLNSPAFTKGAVLQP